MLLADPRASDNGQYYVEAELRSGAPVDWKAACQHISDVVACRVFMRSKIDRKQQWCLNQTFVASNPPKLIELSSMIELAY